MSQEDIDASKAPLMDHLIELRSRLIKSLLAFVVLFFLSFAFAKPIYNILLWPFEWAASGAGITDVRLIYTAPLEYFFTQLQIAVFGAAVEDVVEPVVMPAPAMAPPISLRTRSVGVIPSPPFIDETD